MLNASRRVFVQTPKGALGAVVLPTPKKTHISSQLSIKLLSPVATASRILESQLSLASPVPHSLSNQSILFATVRPGSQMKQLSLQSKLPISSNKPSR